MLSRNLKMNPTRRPRIGPKYIPKWTPKWTPKCTSKWDFKCTPKIIPKETPKWTLRCIPKASPREVLVRTRSKGFVRIPSKGFLRIPSQKFVRIRFYKPRCSNLLCTDSVQSPNQKNGHLSAICSTLVPADVRNPYKTIWTSMIFENSPLAPTTLASLKIAAKPPPRHLPRWPPSPPQGTLKRPQNTSPNDPENGPPKSPQKGYLISLANEPPNRLSTRPKNAYLKRWSSGPSNQAWKPLPRNPGTGHSMRPPSVPWVNSEIYKCTHGSPQFLKCSVQWLHIQPIAENIHSANERANDDRNSP